MKCACRLRNGRQCRNQPTREVVVFGDDDLAKIGTGWFWILICDKHFYKSEYDWTNLTKRGWRWTK